jgi:hypothetical protein
VLFAGTGRTFVYTYIGDVYGPVAEKTRRKMLDLEHFLLTVFLEGTCWQWTMVFR